MEPTCDSAPAIAGQPAGHTIKVDGATVYEDGSCADIKVKAKVSLKGSVVGDNTVLASFVKFED